MQQLTKKFITVTRAQSSTCQCFKFMFTQVA